jgi:DNA repair photolyase
VKENVAEVLRAELHRPSWRGESIAIGAATDPYQPAEGRFRLTRACIEVLSETANPFGLITRGPMIVRDLDVLADAARRAEVSVTFSVPTLDVEVWRLTEPEPPRHGSLCAPRSSSSARIRASVGMAPILPGISDRPDQLAEVVRAAREAGACGIWANVLYLQPGTREHFLESLGREWPELLPEYERLYDGRAYLRAADTAPVRDAVRELSRVHGIRDRRGRRLEPPPPDVQLVSPCRATLLRYHNRARCRTRSRR